MREVKGEKHPAELSIGEFFRFVGARYWTASLLPTLVGATLPFWLRPPGFSFRWLPAIEFLFAIVLLQAGFSFLLARFKGMSTTRWPCAKLVVSASFCFLIACLLGLHLNHTLQLNKYVYNGIFIVYGLAIILVGVLYVVPPIQFWRRSGGEIVIAEGLGMLPLLGAYLIQAGDITRKVYLASLPIIAATGLWVWLNQLVSKTNDEQTGRKTLVLSFGTRFSGRFAVLALYLLLCASLILAVFTGSIPPLALTALLFIGMLWRIVTVSWNHYADPAIMRQVQKSAFSLHLVICFIMAISSLIW